MNDASIDDDVEFATERIVGEQPEVATFDHADAFVDAQRIGQLPVADVERRHVSGAVREQAVREAAGRRADVERSRAGDVDAERLQGRLELLAAAARVRPRADDVEDGRGAHAGARLRDRPAVDADPALHDQRARVRTRDARLRRDGFVEPQAMRQDRWGADDPCASQRQAVAFDDRRRHRASARRRFGGRRLDLGLRRP